MQLGGISGVSFAAGTFFHFFHIGTAFMFVCTSICPYYYILTYLFCVTVIHLLCYFMLCFMLCAFVTYSIKLLLKVSQSVNNAYTKV